MTKQFILSALAICMVGQVSAKELTAQQALNRLVTSNTSANVAAKARRAQAVNSMKLVYTSSLKSQNTYYVFDNNQAGGYVILSADDNMPAVLGYVDEGHFDYNNIPENMKFYLATLDANVRAQALRGVQAKTISGNQISALLQNTKWDQGKPFNEQCPQYAYGANGNEYAYVGCVACAVAQVMRKWQYPTTGIGSSTYKFWWDTNLDKGDKQEPTDSTTFSTDFSAHTYDWANMLDYYDTENKNWNDAQGKAVSTLLKDVGVAAKMCYGTDAAGGSGAQTNEAGYGLVTYFGYDASLQFLDHKFYTNDEWDQMIYDELVAGRPVILGGTGATGSGGHEYVCDGFDGSGKFHINWGWGGSQNGYFLMSGPGLIPAGTGSGGAEAGDSYGYNQDALMHVMPSNDANATGKEADCRMATIGYTAKVSGRKLTLTGSFFNTSYHFITDSVGIRFVSTADENDYLDYAGGTVSLGSNDSQNSISVTISEEEAEGTFTVVPIMKGVNDTNWTAIKVLSTFKAATATITTDDDGIATLSVKNNDAPKIAAQGAVKASKNSFRPTTKKDDGTLDAETLVLTCEAGIKNCDEQGHKLAFGCEFYDLTESDDSTDVYWLTDYESVKTGAEEMAAGASIKEISVEILPELEEGHEYEVNPIFYEEFDDSDLDDDAYWDKLDEIAEYVDLGDNEAPVIKIETSVPTAIKTINAPFEANTSIYSIDGRIVKAASIASLPKGTFIIKDSRGVRKIVKK